MGKIRLGINIQTLHQWHVEKKKKIRVDRKGNIYSVVTKNICIWH